MSHSAQGGPEYQAIINTAVDGIIVIDEVGIVQSFNPAATRIFGYAPDEVIGQNVRMLMPQPHHDRHDDYLVNYHRTGVAKIIGIGREVRGRHKDGTLVSLDLAIAEWMSGGRRHFTGIIRDISDRIRVREELEQLARSLEERVRDEVAKREAAQLRAAQAERMQALGQLAGGIGHDFNNVLQAISGAADLLQRRAKLTEDGLKLTQMIANAAARGASVTERLLAFARRSNLQAEALDVTRLLNDLVRLLSQTLGGAISLRVVIDGSLPPLMADKGQLETVLINLATNARDAIPNSGVITLSAAPVIVGAHDDAIGLPPGHYVRIGVVDTGSGMDPQTLARATEPFFTTKPQGKGTGLGLSMAKGFAEQSGGILEIASSVGQGTVVSLFLPTAEVTTENTVRPDDPSQPRILLVDDDMLVRNVLEEQLLDAGYRVTVAASGNEAMTTFAAEGADLLVTDLSMPGMDGMTLIGKVQEQAPGMPAILITGYAMEHIRLGDRGLFRLLRKPVTAARLYEEVATSLAERRVN
ncbi:MAG: PAS domain S-box protein [Acetobacteraceae bacterium]|nr:PAS domain S-box protein [Pseudomonadota bacterium]